VIRRQDLGRGDAADLRVRQGMEDPVENGAPEAAEGHAIVDTVVTDTAEGEPASLPAEGGSVGMLHRRSLASCWGVPF
jgi:hypothetical protein